MKKLMILVLVLFLSGCGTSTITTFDDCMNAGNPVLESYPRQCVADGKTFTETVEGEVIGGDKDNYGCLTSAGYSYDEDIGACTRSWEITNVNQIKAAKLAVDSLGKQNELTITEIKNMGCIGCYEVVFDINQDKKTIKMENWEVVEKTRKNYCEDEDKDSDYCIEVYEPVCGYDNLDNPVRTFSNSCYACRNEAVIYWIDESCSS